MSPEETKRQRKRPSRDLLTPGHTCQSSIRCVTSDLGLLSGSTHDRCNSVPLKGEHTLVLKTPDRKPAHLQAP